MADKKAIDSAVDEVLEKVDGKAKPEKLVKVSLVKFARRSSLSSCLTGTDDYVVYNPLPDVDYPPSVTDQMHAQTLAQQVKLGSAQMTEDSDSDYDFKVGEKDDGRAAEVSGLTLERMDPAERAEAEYNNSVRIQNELSQQVAQRRREAVELEQAKRREAESQKTSKTIENEVKTKQE